MGKIKTPFTHSTWPSGTSIGIVILLVAVAVVGFLMAVAFMVFMVFVIIWNAQDISNVGPNFWNLLWIVVATLVLLAMINNAIQNWRR